MDEFYMGVYWSARPTSLRQHADLTKAYFQILRQLHPAFGRLFWVGDRADSSVEISPGNENLDELIYRHAGGRHHDWDLTDTDGLPRWDSQSSVGLRMVYNTGRSYKKGGLTVSFHTGDTDNTTPNNVIISLPKVNEDAAITDLCNYDFLLTLFKKTIAYWRPENGLVTSLDFSRMITTTSYSELGWLTYISEARATKLVHDDLSAAYIAERLAGGSLILSLGRQMIAASDKGLVAKAIRLRSKLIADGVLDQ